MQTLAVILVAHDNLRECHMLLLRLRAHNSPPRTPGGRDVPAIGQVENDAGLGVWPELHVAECSQADEEDDDKGHPKVQNKRKLLWVLHLVFERQNLAVEGGVKEVEGKGWETLWRIRHPFVGGPGSGRGLSTWPHPFHFPPCCLSAGVFPSSIWADEWILTWSSKLSVGHGAVGALRIGPDFPSHQEEVIFCTDHKHCYLLIWDNGWLPWRPLGIIHLHTTSVLPYRRLQTWRWLYRRTAGRSPSLPSRVGCWDLGSPERKEKGNGFAMAWKLSPGGELGHAWHQQSQCQERLSDSWAWTAFSSFEKILIFFLW